ncbi:MAG TPA: phospholipase D family protein [Chloroflexota bacterium]|nr:phospholipase D family protein [Chloroflexota bacterium]
MPDRPLPDSSWWAVDPQWFPAGTPPRDNARVQILIDGHETFRAAWEAIQAAQESVWLVDWAMSVAMPLVRGDDTRKVPPATGAHGPGYTVFDLLTAVAPRLDVRVLVWSGSRLFRPKAALARKGMAELREANPRIRGVEDRHRKLSHCHHQKAIVVDGNIAFVGGLDMTNFDVDRWDTTSHQMRSGLNWHDLCLRLEGEAARDVARNFIQRWEAATGEPLAPPTPMNEQAPAVGSSKVQIVRTVCADAYSYAPKGEFGIAWAYRAAILEARSFIYLENQYLWSPAVVDELIAALHRVPDPDFRVVLVLPAHPNIGKGDTDVHVRKLLAADPTGRVRVFTLYTAAPGTKGAWVYKPIYVHAKVAIVDDQWFTVGSANLNGRGLESDSELNAQVRDPELARALRLRLWSEHLGLPEATVASLSAAQAVDKLWTPLAAHSRQVIDGRQGQLGCMAVRYETGAMPGDFSLGELEAQILDR